MHRTVVPVLAIGLGLCGLVSALLSACDPSVKEGASPDLRPPPDLRTGPGNLAIGAACDENKMCPQGLKDPGHARCAFIVEFDRVGACASACDTDADCDTIQPGQAFCTSMRSSGKKECVLFCDSDKRIQGRECPRGWTCIPVQGYKVCQPPQTPQT